MDAPPPAPQPQIVIVLVGFPGCGKTTWAKFHYPNFERLDGDTLKTSTKVAKALLAALEEGKNVIVDATNVTVVRRADLMKSVQMRKLNLMARRQALEVKVYAVVFKYSVETCLARIKQREDQNTAQGIMFNHIPAIAVRKSNSSYIEPKLEEGFDYIGVVNE